MGGPGRRNFDDERERPNTPGRRNFDDERERLEAREGIRGGIRGLRGLRGSRGMRGGRGGPDYRMEQNF